MARPGLMRHRKFARLARLVGSRPLARGHLEMVWEVAYENGDPLLGDAGDVEQLAEWGGEPGVLAGALVESGFLDESPDGLRVHDLWDHAPDYVGGRREKELERRKPKTCANPACGREYRSTDKRAKYCSDRCRKDAHRRGGASTETDADGEDRPAASHETGSDAPPAPAPAPVKQEASPPSRGRANARGDTEGMASTVDGTSALSPSRVEPEAVEASTTVTAEQAARDTARACGADHRLRALADADWDAKYPATARLLTWLREHQVDVGYASDKRGREAAEAGLKGQEVEQVGQRVAEAYQRAPRPTLGWFLHDIAPDLGRRPPAPRGGAVRRDDWEPAPGPPTQPAVPLFAEGE